MERPVQVMAYRRTAKHPIYEFAGVRYYRKPPGYYKTHSAGHEQYLHRAVWIANHGSIPDGYEVHHRDGDREHNDPENLDLLTIYEHHSGHMREAGRVERSRENMRRAVAGAAKWRKQNPEAATTIGRKGMAAARDKLRGAPVELRCAQCGEMFGSYANYTEQKFCSPACQSAFRRASGVDDEERTCCICGAAFRVNKYAPTQTCSRGCRGKKQSHTKRVQYRS